MNLFDLSAKVSVDVAASDRALTENQKKVISLEKEYQKLDKSTSHLTSVTKTHADHTTNLGHAFKALTAQVVIADGPFGGLASRMRAMSTEAGELAATLGPAGPIIAGILAIAGVSLLAGDALFKLAEKTAKYGDDVFKAHEKTALTVETLSALKVAGEAVGVELGTMTTGLIRFTNNLETAASGNKKMIDVFKQLGVTAFQDNDKALQQFIAHFATLRTDQERTVAAGQAFGIRFGASLVEVFNRVGGNVEEFKTKLHEMGLLMTEEDAEAAHKFSIDLEMLEMKIAGVGRTIGRELVPAFDAGFTAIEAALAANKTNWQEWGEFLAKTILSIEPLIGGLVGALQGMNSGGALTALIGGYAGLTSTADTVTGAYLDMKHPLADYAGAAKDMVPGFMQPKRFHIPAEGGGSHADPAEEAKRLSEIRLQSILEGFKGEEEGLKRSLSIRAISLESFTRTAIALAARQHEAAMQGLADEETEASKLRKPAVALAQIALKRDQEIRKSAESIIKYQDTLADEALNNARAREDGILAIRETTAAATADIWRRLADQRVVADETAIKAITRLEMDGLRLQAIQADNELARAGEDKAKQITAQVKIAELQVKMALLSISGENAAADALRSRLRVQLEFNNALAETWRNLHLQSLELDKQKIAHGLDLNDSPKDKRRAMFGIMGIDTEAENVQYRAAQAALRLKLITDQEKASLSERNKLYEAFLAQRDLMDAQHAQNIQEILDRPLVQLHAKMAALANGITNLLDRAITDGFERGMKAGLVSFAQGILDMIKSAVLNALEARLTEIFSNALGGGAGASGGGGGSWLSKLLGFGLSTIAGAAGGAGGGSGGGWGSFNPPLIGSHANGLPYVPFDNYPALLHKGERVMTAAENRGGNGTQTLVVNYHAAPGESPASRATVYQMSKQLHSLQMKVALTG